jgi:hypothetical protein
VDELNEQVKRLAQDVARANGVSLDQALAWIINEARKIADEERSK